MANVELIKVEERLGGELLFNVRVTATAGKMELPIAIKDQGSVASNETMVLQSALGFAKELDGSIRRRLGVEQQGL
ncbi:MULTISPECIES: hypothetical protein [Rhizobium]|uniref:Uncharacterized protein n=1 Tax=Rhizobium paranaense TaxID=1650438 RepID=A0A7W9D4D2_9HYPH|nr:hypothetical protein [Rhizobium paranaense]MBB5577248.1 hypothetical protein [Rhizobium paranaense]